MTKYAMLKRDITLYYVVPPDIIEEKFLNWTTAHSNEILVPRNTIIEVTTSLIAKNYILNCGEMVSILFINESDEWLEFLND